MPVIQRDSKGVISYPGSAGSSLLSVSGLPLNSGVSKGQTLVFIRGFQSVLCHMDLL